MNMTEDKDFIESLGLPFLAHRLRRASEMLLEGTAVFLRDSGIAAPPRSISTLLLLKREGPQGITQIAQRLRLTHPLIIKLVATLEEVGYVSSLPCPTDRRRRVVELTQTGLQQTDRIEEGIGDIASCLSGLFDETGVDLLDAVQRLEEAIRRKPMGERFRTVAGAPARERG
jgi:DNA-binding MarR family transcriptional regulator